MNDMLNKVSANYMDSKFEQSIMELVNDLKDYVGNVNEIAKK